MDTTRQDGERQYRYALTRNRLQLLHRMESWMETPMAVLGLVWLSLLVLELLGRLGEWSQTAVTTIWIVFILDFLLRFALAPAKLRYLRRNWLTALALMLPALRAFRALRAVRMISQARGLRLLRLITSLNRGMKSLGAAMRRRGLGYVIATTGVVTVAGAAGMLAFERQLPDGQGLDDFGTALWWTAMIMTTMGSDYWPRTSEGRALCLLLATYAFAVFGYVTGAIATYLVGREAEDEAAPVAGEKAVRDLQAEVRALRAEIHSARHARPGGP